MRMLRGAPALSEFRRSKLEARLRAAGLPECRLAAELIHFADLVRPLEADEEALLGRLLRYGPAPEPGGRTGEDGEAGTGADHATAAESLLLVVPRPGTISPWSSKATDIARHCGLEAVRRLERGMAYRLQPRSAETLDEAALATAAALLHDRMTEQVLRDPAEAEQLFVQAEPRALARVPLLAQGRAALV
jgi:phosphoribosylformylglycinamidine synthase